MTRLTPTEAAKAGFASRPTIYRRIKEGALTVHKDANGRKLIDAADLVRVFGEPGGAAENKTTAGDISKAAIELDQAKAETEQLRKELAEAHKQAANDRQDAAKERDRLLTIVETNQRLIVDQRSPQGFWSRLFGTR